MLSALLSPTQGCGKGLHEWAFLRGLGLKGILVDMRVQPLCKTSMGSQECQNCVKILKQDGKTPPESHPGMDLATLCHTQQRTEGEFL